MPQPSLDPIAGNRIPPPKSLTTNPTRGLVVEMLIEMHSMDDERWPTHAHPRLVVRRNSFELRILSDRGSTVVDRGDSGGQSGAALAAPGRHDGAAGAGPHPQTGNHGYDCDVDCSAGTCACSRENSQTFRVVTIQVRCSHGTHRRRGEQVAAAAMEATF